MKTALIAFRDEKQVFFGEYLTEIIELFKNGGFEITTLEVFSLDDAVLFKKSFERLSDTVENLVVLGGNAQFNLKEIIAEITDTNLVENDNARSFLDAVSLAKGVTYLLDNAVIPLEATLIPNIDGAYQGFMLDNADFTLAVLPSELEQVKLMADKYFIPFLEKKYQFNHKRLVLKYMGNRGVLERTLKEAVDLSDSNFRYFITEKNGDVKIEIIFDRYKECDSNSSVRYIISKLGDNIYAEYDVDLAERLFDLLKLKKLTLSVAESFTGGRIISELIKNSGASEVIHEGIVCYSNQSKMSRLGVEREKIYKEGAVSSIVAYQMAAGLLRNGASVAISTTGIAGPKSDNSQKPVGLAYIAVGLKDGVHTYKFNFLGDREEITETAKNTALFLAIKKLKKL